MSTTDHTAWEIPPQPTIGVITTVGTYERHVPEWCRSVRALMRKPDKIVITAQDYEKVRSITAKELPQAIVIPGPGEFQFGTYLNTAIDACNTDWISWIGVDDRYRPQALTGIDIVDTDIYIYGMQIQNGPIWQGGDLERALQYNPAPCGSAFRRWIWEILPFQPDLAPFEDWAFWIGARALGATAKPTGRIDFDYSTHEQQISYPQEPAATYVREWGISL